MALEVEFLDVGQGDSTLIKLPNDKWVLVDCHFKGDYENVLDYVLTKLPTDPNSKDKKLLDCLVITHPHEDHISGIGKLADKVTISRIWESGHRIDEMAKKDEANYADYFDMKDLIKKLDKEAKVKELTSYKGGFNELDDNVKWYCLSPSRAIKNATSEEQVHEACLVLKLEYGENSILFTGDTSWKAWKNNIMNNYKEYVNSTVLQVSHHGSITFFADSEESEELYLDHLNEINPDVSIISVGEGNRYNHPHKKAIEQYKELTAHPKNNHQVFQTKDMGTVLIVFNKKTYSVYPSHIYSSIQSPTFNACRAWLDVTPSAQVDGTYVKGQTLKFSLKYTSLPSDIKIKTIRWEVQNNGVGNDSTIHDWYEGSEGRNTETFRRETGYEGNHSLYVLIKSHKNNIIAEFVHKVKVK